MYAIYTHIHWSIFPVTDPFEVAKFISVEGPFEFESDDLNCVINELNTNYVDKVYKIPYKNNGNKCFLCYIVNDNYDIIGGIDFDKSFHMIK